MVDNVEIGKKIREHRLKAGLTQEKLAELLEITLQQVQKYERGITKVNLVKLQQLAEILKVPISDFFDESPFIAYNLSEKEIKLLESYREIKDGGLKNSLILIADGLRRRSR